MVRNPVEWVGAGFLSVFLMREVTLRGDRAAQWGLQDEKEKDTGEKEKDKEVRVVVIRASTRC